MDNNYEEMFEAIDACYYKALIMPCLSLIYTVIDSIAWLAYGSEEEKSKQRFIKWSEKYLLPHMKNECSAIDLYSARCSILHGLSWESDLSKTHKAKSIVYSFGCNTENSSVLDKEIFSQDYVASIHIDTFIEALKNAVNKFFVDVGCNQTIKNRVAIANGKKYAKVRIIDYEKIISQVKALKL